MWTNENNNILGRGNYQTAIVTQTQRKEDENASLIKVPSQVANTDKNNMMLESPLCTLITINE